jgi:hypothetical protein
MEKLYFNLSEEEFSRGRKLLLWGFTGLFFLAGIYVLFSSLILEKKSIPAEISFAPFGISIIVAIISAFATIKRKDLFFSIDNEKIEFRYGVFRPQRRSFNWIDVKDIVMPQKQKKAMLRFKDGSSYVIDLTWLQKKKTSLIRKHLYITAREKNLDISKVRNLMGQALS